MKCNHKSWDEYLPYIKFSYNIVVHRTTEISLFEVVYGFNPLTPLVLFIKKGFLSLSLSRICMNKLDNKYNIKLRDTLSTIIRG